MTDGFRENVAGESWTCGMWSTVWRPAPNPEVEGAELTQQEIPEQFDWIGNARRSPKAMQGLVASNSPTQFTVFEDIVGTIELCEVAVYTPLGTLLRRIPLLVMLSSAQYAVASPPLQVDEVPIADSKSARKSRDSCVGLVSGSRRRR